MLLAFNVNKVIISLATMGLREKIILTIRMRQLVKAAQLSLEG